MTHSLGADSEVGCLRTVLMHRPGPELRRLTPRTQNLLRADGLDRVPWVARAQQEHDMLADVLRGLGAEVIYLTELLQDVFGYATARGEAIASVLANCDLGEELATVVSRHLEALGPEDLATALVAGLTHDELRSGRGLVYDLLEPRDFVVAPLPNLMFSKDASTWIGDQVVIGALPGARRRETDLLGIAYRRHPRFAGMARPAYQAGCGSLDHGRLDCGDVVQLGPGVVAVGAGGQSTPASVELLARHLLEDGVADSVLAVPMTQRAVRAAQPAAVRATGTLDSMCTVLDVGVVLMVPALAFTLMALTMTMKVRHGEVRVSRPRPFIEAAAQALNVDRLTVVDTGVESLSSARGQWDDGGNALAVGDRAIVCDERNAETNARLRSQGFDVVTVPFGELGGIRGGPACMCVPLLRAPATERDRSFTGLPVTEPAPLSSARPRAVGPGRAVPRPATQSEPDRELAGASAKYGETSGRL